MKKIFLIALVAIVLCMFSACKAKQSDSVPTDVEPIEEATTVAAPTAPTFDSEKKFNGLFNYLENPDSEDLALLVVQSTEGAKNYVFSLATEYITDLYREPFYIESVDCSIFNYDMGGTVGIVSFNGGEYGYNYTHQGCLLAASLLSKQYSDSVSLADARVSALALSKMTKSDVQAFCIEQNADGEYFYNLSLRKNANLAKLAKTILINEF